MPRACGDDIYSNLEGTLPIIWVATYLLVPISLLEFFVYIVADHCSFNSIQPCPSGFGRLQSHSTPITERSESHGNAENGGPPGTNGVTVTGSSQYRLS